MPLVDGEHVDEEKDDQPASANEYSKGEQKHFPEISLLLCVHDALRTTEMTCQLEEMGSWELFGFGLEVELGDMIVVVGHGRRRLREGGRGPFAAILVVVIAV